jgi:hypothetical protein
LLGGRGQMARSANPFQFGPIANTRTSGIPSWLTPNSISRFLGQTQQILHTGQQLGGMVQQYGPIIKNLPALWKIYRSVNTSQENKEDKTNQATSKKEGHEDDKSNQATSKQKGHENDKTNQATSKQKSHENDKQNKEHLVLTDDDIKELEKEEFFQDYEESKEHSEDDQFSHSINKKENYQEKQSVPKLFI